MAASVKIGRALAALLVDNLPAYFGSAEEAAGVKLPRMGLNHPDRLSRSDAQELYRWLMSQNDVRAAYRDGRLPDHQLVRGLFALANHFIHDHPQGPDGEPAPWPEPLSPAIAGLIAGTREKIEASELTPAEARDMLQWAAMDQEHAAALHDRKHLEHAEVLAEWQALHERAASEPAAAPTGALTAPIGATPAAGGNQAKIAELRAHPAFRDGRHPEHRAVVAELGNLLAGVPDGTRPTPAAGTSRISVPAAAAPTTGASGAPVNRVADLTQSLRGNRFFGSTERRQTLADLEAELLKGDGASSAAPPAAG